MSINPAFRNPFCFDAMYGSAQNVLKNSARYQTFQDVRSILPLWAYHPIRCEEPAPDRRYIFQNNISTLLLQLTAMATGYLLYGKENFIDSHHIFFAVSISGEYKKLPGTVVQVFQFTDRLNILCTHYGLEVIRNTIGFKEILRIIASGKYNWQEARNPGGMTQVLIPRNEMEFWIGLTIFKMAGWIEKETKRTITEIIAITVLCLWENGHGILIKNVRNKILDNC